MTFNLNKYKVYEGDFTHLLLSGGKFKIPENKYNDLWEYILKNPQYSLCERLPEKFHLYFDIDGLPEQYDIENVVQELINSIKENFEIKKEKEQLEYYLLQNQVKHRNYHIHFPGITVNKNICKIFVNMLNSEIYDAQAYNTCLRMYGAWKHNHKIGKSVKNSNYKLITKHNWIKNDLDIFSVLSLHGYGNNSLIEFTDKTLNSKVGNIRKLNYSNTVSSFDEINDDDLTSSYQYYRSFLLNNDCKVLKHILNNCLSSQYYSDREKWLSIIYSLYHLKAPITVAIEWSEKYNNHDQNRINQLNAIYKSNPREDGQNITYIKLLIEGMVSNIKEFNKIIWPVDQREYINYKINDMQMENGINYGISGDAYLIYNIYKGRIISNPIKKNFYELYYWNGDIWDCDISNIYTIKLINNNLLHLYIAYLKKIIKAKNECTDDLEEKLLNTKITEINKKLTLLRNSCSYSKNVLNYVSEMLKNSKIKMLFNTNRDYIAVKNGNVNLKTGELKERLPEDYNTFALDVEYKSDMDYSSVDDFFSDIMLNRDNLTNYLQKVLGYSITGYISEQKLCIFNGVGSNGKSLTMDSLTDLLDESKYMGNLSGNALSTNNKSGNATTHLNSFENKRIVLLDESAKGERLNEGAIKRMTGSKRLTIRKLYKEEECIQMLAQIIVCTNFVPKVSDDYAIHRRLLLIPFDAEFKDKNDFDENNPNHRLKLPENVVKDMLKPEKLLIWLVQGAMKWFKEGLGDTPEEINAFKNDIIKKSDILSRFFNEELFIVENEEEYSGIEEIYNLYLKYSGESSKTLSIFDFKQSLKEKRIKTVLSRNGTHKLPYQCKI